MISPAYSKTSHKRHARHTEAEQRTTSDGTTTGKDDSVCVLELATPRLDVFEDSIAIIGEGKRTLPLCTGGEHEDVVLDTFTRGKNESATGIFALLNGGDTTDLYGTIAINEEAIIGNKNIVLEFALRGSSHADAGRKVNGEWSGSHKGERSGASIDLRGEDASDGGTCGTTTDDNNALAGSRHFQGGEEIGRGGLRKVRLRITAMVEISLY